MLAFLSTFWHNFKLDLKEDGIMTYEAENWTEFVQQTANRRCDLVEVRTGNFEIYCTSLRNEVRIVSYKSSRFFDKGRDPRLPEDVAESIRLQLNIKVEVMNPTCPEKRRSGR